jgi:putative hydrolase of HD superfamily
MADLYTEMKELSTTEARIYKAIDNLEAVIQHNLSDISTWIPLEFDLNLTYGNEKVAFSPYLTALRDEIRKDTIRKIDENK